MKAKPIFVHAGYFDRKRVSVSETVEKIEPKVERAYLKE